MPYNSVILTLPNVGTKGPEAYNTTKYKAEANLKKQGSYM